jgi:hypothetical protein
VDVMSLPTAARRLGRSAYSLRWLLRQRPDLDGAITRVGGRRMFRPADLEIIAAAYARRTRKRPAPYPTP